MGDMYDNRYMEVGGEEAYVYIFGEDCDFGIVLG